MSGGGGSRRPYSRGRWPSRYKDYWDYDTYSEGSSAGSPKECGTGSPPPLVAPPRVKRDHSHVQHQQHQQHPQHQHHRQQQQRRLSGGAERRAERRHHRPNELRVSPGGGAGSSHDYTHQHHQPPGGGIQTREQAVAAAMAAAGGGGGVGAAVGAAGGGGGKGDSPVRKRRRIHEHITTVEPAPPAVSERRQRHYHHNRRPRYVSGWPDRGAGPHAAAATHHQLPHQHPHQLLIDINPMSVRSARLGALGGPIWPHQQHHHQQQHHPHPHHRDHLHHHTHAHAPRTQVVGAGLLAAGVGMGVGGAAAELWPHAVLPALPLRYHQMGGVYGGYTGYAPPPPHAAHAPRAPFATSPHAHYITTQRQPHEVSGGGADAVPVSVGALHADHHAHQLHHAPPLLINTEGRGAPLELMSHHTRHHLHNHRRSVGAGVVPVSGAGPPPAAPPPRYVRAAARWPHALTAATVGALTVVSPPPYQVFLNLLAMFPLSPYGEAREGSEPASPEPENYEALLSLAERLGEAKPRGLQRQEIQQLPSYKWSGARDSGAQQSCVVCMSEFESRQLLRVLPCAHEFHAHCVDRWLRSNRTCPICRGNASEYFNTAE